MLKHKSAIFVSEKENAMSFMTSITLFIFGTIQDCQVTVKTSITAKLSPVTVTAFTNVFFCFCGFSFVEAETYIVIV